MKSIARLSLIVLIGGLLLHTRPDRVVGSTTASINVPVQIDGAQRFQQVDGFGVNANGASWDAGTLAPALDLLTDTLGANIWRVILERSDWEITNDNIDPNTFNWNYYATIYENPKFQSLWNTIAYINQKGHNQVVLSMMGSAPSWMGKDVINVIAEDEWVEMIASVLYYGRFVKKLDFTLVSPLNEVDHGTPEGPDVSPIQYARLTEKLLVRLQSIGLTDIMIVPPDIANVANAQRFLDPILTNSFIMSHVNHFSFHSYGGEVGDIDSILKHSAYPDRNFWMTEFSAWCSGCDSGSEASDQWLFATQTTDFLLEHIKQGAASALVYDAYDSYYEHHGSVGYWGLLAYDAASKTYTPRKRFYTNAQVLKFTQPGMVHIGSSTSNTDLKFVALTNSTTGKVTLVGHNPTDTPIVLQATLANLPTVQTLALYQTTPLLDLARGDDVSVSNNTFSVQIAPNSVFTLSNLLLDSPPLTDTEPPVVVLSAPQNDATLVGTTVVAANASDNLGVMNVQFFLDGVSLGIPLAIAPYTIAWDTTSASNGRHSLTAEARDITGNTRTSVPVSVTVANPTPPLICAVSPPEGMTDASVHTTITAAFSKEMDQTSINTTTVELHESQQIAVPITVTYDVPTRTILIVPSRTLAHATTYTVTLNGGLAAPQIKDIAGIPLATRYSWSLI